MTTEVTPQHLLLNETAYEKIGTLAQMNPPLRTAKDNEILWQALKDDVIDFIATDRAPHNFRRKSERLSQFSLGHAWSGNIFGINVNASKGRKMQLRTGG